MVGAAAVLVAAAAVDAAPRVAVVVVAAGTALRAVVAMMAGTAAAAVGAVADALPGRKAAWAGPGHGKADIVRSILRIGLSVVLATVLAASAAWAVDYDTIFELTQRNVDERTIVQLIVDDGRAFELSDEEIVDLRVAGVSEHVIDAMIDPAAGKAWLAGDVFEGLGETLGGGETGNGYRSSLDEEYGQGEVAGDGSTPLVFSFGYYYGPLSRYYYDDPYYFPFWSAGYASSYWPSYYAYGWRPADDEYYAYPYNWYEYSSYYCHTYYDPGYWTEIGYTVQPASGSTVWDDGPRFRGGGIIPPKGGRPDAVSGERLAVGGAGRMRNPAAPPAIRESVNPRTLGDRFTRSVPVSVSSNLRRAEIPFSRPGVAVRGGAAANPVAERRARALAARELRAARERANAEDAAAGEAWARRVNAENLASATRWGREWEQPTEDVPYARPAEGPARSRETAAAPPPPAAPARPEQPRTERAPAPDRGSAGGRNDTAGDAPVTRSRGGR